MKPCTLSSLLILCAIAGGPFGLARAGDTNAPTSTVTLENPDVTTNAIPVTTNAVPGVKPKATDGLTGTTLLGAFGGCSGGKFSVSGRILRLPTPAPPTYAISDWRRNLDFGVNQSRGNTETLRYSLGLHAVKDREQDLFRIHGRAAYGESDGTRDTENASAGLRYERMMTKRVYALMNLDWVTDTIADLDYRATGILSPGLHLIRSETTVFNLEAGAGYVQEKKNEDVEGYAAGRAASTIEHILNERVLAWFSAEYLPKLEDPGIFFVNSEAGIASALTRDLSLNVYYQRRYDSNPAEGKKSTDSVLATALSLTF